MRDLYIGEFPTDMTPREAQEHLAHMKPNPSILAEVRSKAYSEAWSQASMVMHDAAIEKGRLEGRAERNSEHKRWWLFGVLCGVGLSAIVGAFL